MLYVFLIFYEDVHEYLEWTWNVFELGATSDAAGPGHIIVDPGKDRDY